MIFCKKYELSILKNKSVKKIFIDKGFMANKKRDKPIKLGLSLQVESTDIFSNFFNSDLDLLCDLVKKIRVCFLLK
jgi:hypothetical protein